MNVFLRKSGATVAAALLASSCAASLPSGSTGILGDPAGKTVGSPAGAPGSVMVPVTLPALPDRDVLFAYNRDYINTVEVRLRDSHGNESVQIVARNAYLAGSTASGTVNLLFHNVMPGTCTLTVRTSHERLLASTARVSYDSVADVFFADANSSHGFDPGEKEYPLVTRSGTTVANSNFLVFAQDSDLTGWAFTDSVRRDVSNLAGGFGVGAATQSIVAGTVTSVGVTVGQLPMWNFNVHSTSREVTAGDTVTLRVDDVAAIQASDSVLVVDPSVSFDRGIVDLDNLLLSFYAPNVDAAAGTVAFTPFRATSTTAGAAPTAWPIWFVRGQAAAERAMTAQGPGTNAPRLIVHPAIANQGASRIFGALNHVSRAASTPVQYDLRDEFGNLVAGNVTGVNEIALNTLRLANAGISMDFGIVSHSYTADPRNGLSPFILPGRTTGTVNAAGVYTQGTTAPGPISTAATYSATLADGTTASTLRLTRLEIPYHIYDANQGSFGAGAHVYVLNMAADPDNGTRTWISLQRQGGPTIASASVDASLTTARNISLNLNNPPAGTLPVPIVSTQAPVVIAVPARAIDTITEDGTLFSVADYGARRVSDADTVRARVLNNRASRFTGDVAYQWLP